MSKEVKLFLGGRMNKANLEKWQAIEDEFLNSDLDEAAFCKSRKLNLDQEFWRNFGERICCRRRE
jgi:hypothetical protein